MSSEPVDPVADHFTAQNAPPLLHLTGAGGLLPNGSVMPPLQLALQPGLTWITGGEGRGKSTLLALMAGTARVDGPEVGQLVWQVARPAFGPATTTSLETPTDPKLDPDVAADWLATRSRAFPAWQADTAAKLVEAFALAEHLHKPFYMLSAGSRRKMGLVVSAASGAHVTLLDTPFAALDGRSIRVLCELLAAAANTRRAWVVADYMVPAALAQVALSAAVDLGD